MTRYINGYRYTLKIYQLGHTILDLQLLGWRLSCPGLAKPVLRYLVPSTAPIWLHVVCQFVRLVVNIFATDPLQDNVTVYDGNGANTTLITQLSGQLYQLPRNNFTSTQRYMFVTFISDSWQSGLIGFQATYQTIGEYMINCILASLAKHVLA